MPSASYETIEFNPTLEPSDLLYPNPDKNHALEPNRSYPYQPALIGDTFDPETFNRVVEIGEKLAADYWGRRSDSSPTITVQPQGLVTLPSELIEVSSVLLPIFRFLATEGINHKFEIWINRGPNEALPWHFEKAEEPEKIVNFLASNMGELTTQFLNRPNVYDSLGFPIGEYRNYSGGVTSLSLPRQEEPQESIWVAPPYRFAGFSETAIHRVDATPRERLSIRLNFSLMR